MIWFIRSIDFFFSFPFLGGGEWEVLARSEANHHLPSDSDRRLGITDSDEGRRRCKTMATRIVMALMAFSCEILSIEIDEASGRFLCRVTDLGGTLETSVDDDLLHAARIHVG